MVKKGFTLIEVVVVMVILAIVIIAPMEGFVINKRYVSFAKHKLQASYLAQNIIEQKRRLPFANIGYVAPTQMSIDTNGTFGTDADDFKGTVTINVTSLDPSPNYRKKVLVTISWNEPILGGSITMTERYATTIANEPQLN